MKPRVRELMIESGYAAPEIAGRAHKFAKLMVKECAAVVNAKKALCGSGVPDTVLLDMVIKDMFAYLGDEE